MRGEAIPSSLGLITTDAEYDQSSTKGTDRISAQTAGAQSSGIQAPFHLFNFALEPRHNSTGMIDDNI